MTTTTVNASGSEVPQRLNNKVFVDGLPYHYPDEPGKMTLEGELMQFVSDWKVGRMMRLLKKDGQGFGYIAFRSPHSVDVAVRVLNGRKFLGRPLRVEEPKPRDLDRLQEDTKEGLKDHGKSSFSRQVLLSDLAKNSQPDLLREVLRDVAPQLEAKVEMIKMTSNNRKAFLTLTDEDDVDAAVNFLNGFSMLGRNIAAQRAMAPGSLPFSKQTAGQQQAPRTPFQQPAEAFNKFAASTPATVPAEIRLRSTEAQGKKTILQDDDDEDDKLVPLGHGVSFESKPTKGASEAAVKSAAAQQTTTKAPATTTKPSSSKYDLMDKGCCDIYVGNLGDDTTVHQLQQHFAPAGNIKSCKLLTHPTTKEPLGIGHVTYTIPAYAKYAVEHLHGSRLRGSVLRVDRGDQPNPVPVSDNTTLLQIVDEPEVIDEDAFARERYGVKNGAASYLRGTSAAASSNSDAKKKSALKKKSGTSGSQVAEDEDSDGDVPFPVKSSSSSSSALSGGKKQADNKKTLKRGRVADEEEWEEETAAPPTKKSAVVVTADDDSDEEEHFHDADADPKKGNKKAAKKPATKKKPVSSHEGTVSF